MQGSYSGEHSRLTYCSFRNFTTICKWRLASIIHLLGIDVPDFYELLSQFYSGVHIGICLGRVHWNTIRTMGCTMSFAHTWLVLSFSGSNDYFCGLVSASTHGFILPCFARKALNLPFPWATCCVEWHRPNHASPWINAVHRSQPVLIFCFISGTCFLAKVQATVLLFLSFTLNQPLSW